VSFRRSHVRLHSPCYVLRAASPGVTGKGCIVVNSGFAFFALRV